MATTTKKLGLTKPDLEDNVSIEKFNENFDKIDALGDLIPLKEQVNKLKFVTLTLGNNSWSGSAPYTQTVNVSGMTEDWIPGIPTIVLGSSVDVSTLLAATEALGCIKMIASAAGTLTFTAPEDKPGVSLTLRVPGQIER